MAKTPQYIAGDQSHVHPSLAPEFTRPCIYTHIDNSNEITWSGHNQTPQLPVSKSGEHVNYGLENAVGVLTLVYIRSS